MSETFTVKDVAEHNTVDNGLYIIIDSNVYSMASFVDDHPGGSKILKRVGGKDATQQFWKVRIPGDTLLQYIMAGIPDNRILWRGASS